MDEIAGGREGELGRVEMAKTMRALPFSTRRGLVLMESLAVLFLLSNVHLALAIGEVHG